MVRVLVALALLFLLLRKLQFNTAWSLLRSAQPPYLFFAFLSFFLFVLVSVIRWQLLLNCKGLHFFWGYLLKVYFISLFFNNLLPTAIGGDLFRMYYTTKRREGVQPALAVVLFDRLIGFIGLFAFALLALSFFPLFGLSVGRGYLELNLVGLLFLAGGTGLLLNGRLLGFFRKIWLGIRFRNWGEKFDSFALKLNSFSQNLAPLTFSLLLSLFVQLLLALVWYFSGLAIRKSISPLYYFLYIPLINVVTMVPVSFGGLGIREGGFVYLFSKVGLIKEEAMSISILFLVMNYIHSLIGGLLFVGMKKKGGRDESF